MTQLPSSITLPATKEHGEETLTTPRAIRAHFELEAVKEALQAYLSARPEMANVLHLRDDEERYREYWDAYESIKTRGIIFLHTCRTEAGREWMDAYFAEKGSKQ